MKILKSKFDLVNFFAYVRNVPSRVLMLDYDGTLAPFYVTREAAVPYPGVTEALYDLLTAGHTRLILVSGRSTKDLLSLIRLDPQPEIWGSHGYERLLPDGTYETEELSPQAFEDLARLHAWLEELGLIQYCEKKPASLAIHWRGLPPEKVASIRTQVLSGWSLLVPRTRVRLYEFDGGIELCVNRRSKGDAIKTVLSELNIETALAYLGDDLTDEDAFKALKGRGLSVLVRQKYRPTAADIWLKPPQELLEFLQQWKLNADAAYALG